MSRTDPQINVRLTAERHRVLDAAAFVRRKGPTDLAREAVEAAIDRYGKEEPVKQALAAQDEQKLREASSVAHLAAVPDRRARRRPKPKSP